MSQRKDRLLFLLPAAGVLAADVATKLLVYHSLSLNRGPIPILGNWVRLTYVHNPWAAFGFFHGSRWFFVGVSTLSAVIVLALALGRRYTDLWIRISFGLILGGALGNLADRIRLGEVIDFLDVGIGTHRWPIFNVADCGVTVGVILLALRLLAEGRGSVGAQDEATEISPGPSSERMRGADGEANSGHGG